MTFLELCQELVSETGIAGNGPTSVTTQVGIFRKVVRWVQRAYTEVQFAEPTWSWLWREGQFHTVIGKRDYDPATDLGLTDFNQWDKHSLFVLRPDESQRWPMQFMEFEVFRNFFIFQDMTSQVMIHTFTPNKVLRFDHKPNLIETVQFEYWRTPFKFVNNSDVPAFPEQHHDIILYKALMLYAADEEAPAIYADAEKNYLQRLERLRDAELVRPHIDMVPLA